jgi:hypothetical protein
MVVFEGAGMLVKNTEYGMKINYFKRMLTKNEGKKIFRPVD